VAAMFLMKTCDSDIFISDLVLMKICIKALETSLQNKNSEEVNHSVCQNDVEHQTLNMA
jgi:hypothetical protein